MGLRNKVAPGRTKPKLPSRVRARAGVGTRRGTHARMRVIIYHMRVITVHIAGAA